MGGYGGVSGRIKEKCYYNTGGHKVTDKNAIEVAEYYINEGKYVAFLQEKPPQKRADLSVEGQHVEVKGLKTLNPDSIEGRIQNGFEQVHGDDYRYHQDTYKGWKVVLLSRHDSDIPEERILNAMRKGFLSAEHKGYVTGKLEVWIRGKIYMLN